MTIDVLDIKGKEVSKIKLDSFVFDGKVNHELMHQAVITHLANQRKGLASAKTRGEVSGSGKKPWRQKGTGRARIGSIRSPLWKKGGITFGPKPHSYHKDLPKKMKAMALKSALNAKLNEKEILILNELKVASRKTKDFFRIVKDLKLDKSKTRFIVENLEDNLKLASRNIENINIGTARNLNTYEALNCKNLVFTKDSLKGLEDRIKKCAQ
jgi:large subunit ribosomal protein L4